ncbi:cystathionine gamma-synthase family protein [Microbaculum marinum]|uniref:Cystathionine gamma-synthase family protein n=1 Tax=Microbaculum marinum TaxID=1764581 RepID=A0AAW9RZD4_9HYPH
MKSKGYHHDHIGGRRLHGDTLMLSYGFDPGLSEGAIKPPVFLTSTFAYPTAEDGRRLFDETSGRSDATAPGGPGLLYSRFNNPNVQIVEERLSVLEGAETCALFSSGMAAISTTLLAATLPGDVVLHSNPLYGGTDALIRNVLRPRGVESVGFLDGVSESAIREAAEAAMALGRVAVIFAETPSNPTNTLVDIAALGRIAGEIEAEQGHRPLVVVDNTFLGPLFQKPLELGADIVVYSITKYVAGHSDLVAGAALGSKSAMQAVKVLRPLLGPSLDPHSAWMIGRSLETLHLRMERAFQSAERIARWLDERPEVTGVCHPALLPQDAPARAVYERQCTAGGATFSFTVAGGEPAAFATLDAFRIIKQAVSLGGSESLACHPGTTVHSSLSKTEREALGVSGGLIRLSIGLEHPDDLIADLEQALAAGGAT